MAGLTLAELHEKARRKVSLPQPVQRVTLTDLVGKEKARELATQNRVRAKKRKLFSQTDAHCAEILARFGWEAYQAWNNEKISPERMTAMLNAERAREARQQTHLEMVLVAAVSATVKRYKGEKKPKGLDQANQLIKQNLEIIKGERR